MKEARVWILVIGILLILGWASYALVSVVRNTTQAALQPVNDMTGSLATQVSNILNPTPTILPDPVTIIRDIRTLTRLETIQYSIEKVVTAKSSKGSLDFLFGDQLIFVAHGIVVAGVDLSKLAPEDIWMDGAVLHVRLPNPEIFITTLDNHKSYVYDRETGIFTHGDIHLETSARQVAEDEIEKAAIEDGILNLARQNAEQYLFRLIRNLGYPDVIFIEYTPDD